MRVFATLTVVLTALCAVVTVVFVVLATGHARPAGAAMSGGVSAIGLALSAVAFAVVGRLVIIRVPGNRVGPILCVNGLLFACVAGGVYANYALFVAEPPLPAIAAVVLYQVPAPAGFGLIGVVLLLFPDGRLPSPRWRAALIVSLTGIAAVTIGLLLRPGPSDPPFELVDNPFGIPGLLEPMDALVGLGWALMGLGDALAAVAMVVRLRRATGIERQQLKWMALGAGILGVVFPCVVLTYLLGVDGGETIRDTALAVGIAAFPITAGVAILRFRLYDFDVVVNRALVYGALTATLAATYIGTVLLLQAILLSETSGLAVAISTLAVAALFRPARARIQDAVDRRFYRRRYDAERTIEAFSARMRDQVELDALGAELRAVVDETMQPKHVSLWLK